MLIINRNWSSRYLIIGLVLICASVASAQSDSLADCFPLAVGNRWIYQFDHWMFELGPFGVSGTATTDTGITECVILEKTDLSDSVLWTFQERREFHRHIHNGYNGQVTDTTIVDSTYFQLLEVKSGRNPLLRVIYCWGEPPGQCDLGFFFRSAIPFLGTVPDTARFYRYQFVDSTRIKSSQLVYENVSTQLQLTLEAHKGIVSLIVGYVPICIECWENARYALQSSVILGIRDRPILLPSVLSLEQNYPNPFNPVTVIEYDVPLMSRVKLAVFTLLGQDVLTLVDGSLPPGHYSTQLDGSRLATGIYILKLSADNSIVTKKIVLLR